MSEHDLETLLGGFAADQLTAEEKQRLYSAALQDQELFNALADEQALKELLADPAVRRRLLNALSRPSGAGGSLSWLDWFRRPAGLAYAGGLAAAALAVVLGIRIYQDSLKQAGPSVATEETAPASPPTPMPPASQPTPPSPAESQPQRKESVAPARNLQKKDASAGKPAEPERPAPLNPQAAAGSEAVRDSLPQGRESESKAPEPIAAAPLAGAVASSTQGPSARALFYQTIQPSAEPERQTEAMQEAPPSVGSSREGTPQGLMRMDRKRATARRPDEKRQTVGHPLGLRYSLIMKGPGGIDMEVDPTTPVGKDDDPRLAVQTNEDGYLSVHYARSTSGTLTLLFPLSGDGRIAGRRPIAIALEPAIDVQTAEQIQLQVIFSRAPRDVTGQKLPDTHAPRVLIERVDPSQPGAPAEQAVYVVNPEAASNAVLSVEIPLMLRP